MVVYICLLCNCLYRLYILRFVCLVRLGGAWVGAVHM